MSSERVAICARRRMGPDDVSEEHAEDAAQPVAETPPEPPGAGSGLGADGAFSTDPRRCLVPATASPIACMRDSAEMIMALEASDSEGAPSQP